MSDPIPATRPHDLNSVLEPIRAKYDLPALAGAIVTGDGITALGAVGVREYGSTVPVTVKDQFHLGSCTKAMTATLLAMLIEEGKLSWHTTLEQAFPELTGIMNPQYRTVTLEQILAHRGGFSGESWPAHMTFLELHRLPGTPRQQRETYALKALQQPPEAKPGTKYIYANMGYAILGVVIERTTNRSWEDLMQTRLFHPLGMTTAGFGAMGTPGKQDQPWQHILNNGKHIPIEPGPEHDNPAVIGPAGTVHCSIGDWAKFVQAHLRGERGQDGLLKAATFQKLHTALFGGDYASGWLVTERPWAGGRVLTHAGSNNQNFAVVWMAPLKNFAVLIATNQGGTEAAKACDETAATLIQLHQEHETLPK